MDAGQGDKPPPTPSQPVSGPSETEPVVEGEGELEDGVTMLDVLEEEEALESDCDAVLGGFSDSTCTYSLGYLARQPLYACRSCTKDGEMAGICLGCSYQCHEGCNLVELYTKRNFRCDCGSSKMSSRCRLEPEKQENSENSYNQNFTGLYCTCRRPYPDPEDPLDDVMIQCVVCEDWFHGRHLARDSDNSSPPAEDLYAEMICYGCVGKFSFLQSYAGLAISQGSKAGNEREEVNVTTDPGGDSKAVADGGGSALCKLKPSSKEGEVARTLFFPDKWRKNLCRCPDCLELYAAKQICFLTEEEDTVLYYETRAKEKKKGTLEHGMEALSKMDRVKQVEAIHSYNNMKENLMEYLSKFANSKKVVREEDIREFFQGINSNKKMKTGGAPPSSCK